jgi:hypothetical protein
MSVPSRSALVLLIGALGVSVLAGCACNEDDRGFGSGAREEPDTPPDDDTATPQPPVAPVIDQNSVRFLDADGNPATLPISGPIQVTFTITDPDSTGYSITMTVSTGGLTGVFNDATVINATDPPNVFEEEVPNVTALVEHANSLQWDTVTDIPTVSATVAIQLCPRDAEGNSGDCYVYPPGGDIVIENTLESGLGAFCEPGHVEERSWLQGRVVVPLSDDTCINYKETVPVPQPDDFSAQFMIVMVNPNSETVRFSITQSAEPPLGLGLPPLASSMRVRPAPRRELPAMPAPPPPPCGPFPATLTEADVHLLQDSFGVVNDVDEVRGNELATLQALGEHVEIWVDNETPMDWDADCNDPTNPLEPSIVPAYGLTNCDFEAVADIIDANVYPTVTGLFGEPSDVDQNGRVAILISPRVNGLTMSNDDDGDDRFLVKSYAQPEVDLWAPDSIVNPGSNAREVIYMYAPDPIGLWSLVQVPLGGYLGYELAGRFAVALESLISYAHHRDICDAVLNPTDPIDLGAPPAEADWLDDGLGLLAADLSGFGATAYEDAWIYLDRSNLQDLTSDNTLLSFQDRGGQYLFARYLFDIFGAAVLPNIIDSDEVGIQSIIQAVGSEDFDDFALQWAAAMAVSGRQNPLSPGDLLVPDAVVPNYHVATSAVVSDPPQPGELYGANGFQVGFNLRGDNRVYANGTNPGGGTEIPDLRVRTENLDPALFHPGTDFYGQVARDYGVTAILVSGLTSPTNYLLIQTEAGHDLLGAVVRIEDTLPTSWRLTLEDILNAVPTTVVDLGTLDENGAERNVIGIVSDSWPLTLVESVEPPQGDDDDTVAPAAGDDDSAAQEVSQELPDTDRFGFNLTAGASVGIWLDRRIVNLSGEVPLDDPFVAVARAEDVPDVLDLASWNLHATSPCYDGTIISPPLLLPAFVSAQGSLIPDPVSDETSEFTPLAGGTTSTYECAYDLDQDGIADFDEVVPSNLIEQILQRQAENLADTPSVYGGMWQFAPAPYNLIPEVEPWWGDGFIDLDSNESPDDDLATAYLAYNIGGRAVEGGEEAVWAGWLPAGDYVIIVGGVGGATGPYDLSVRLLQ